LHNAALKFPVVSRKIISFRSPELEAICPPPSKIGRWLRLPEEVMNRDGDGFLMMFGWMARAFVDEQTNLWLLYD
jgi:hypothetical protein